MKQKVIEIDYGRKENLRETFYYFRLGAPYKLWNDSQKCYVNGQLDEGGNSLLVIPPRGYAKVKTKEYFRLHERVIGIFGPVSDIIQEGLALHNSPFIDPFFKGHLELGLQNMVNHNVQISFNDLLGKISFFDISDTYPISPKSTNVQVEEKITRRSIDDEYDDFEVWDEQGKGTESLGDA